MTDWWHTKQWRLIQTNLREIDMRDIRAAQVVADLRAFEANVLMINAAGIIASYPTKLPFQFQSPFLTGDSLLDIIEACHAADIRVFARTDFSKVRRPIYEAHPDWAYISPMGLIVDYNGDVHVCINGPYQQTFAPRIIHELLSTHDFDGIFFDMGGYQTRDYSGNYYGICHCRHCTRLFEEMYGLDLGDPVFRAYTQFKQRTLRAHHEKVYRFIADRWPHICIANHTDFRRGFIRQESNTAIDRPLPHWQYNASDNTKWAGRQGPGDGEQQHDGGFHRLSLPPRRRVAGSAGAPVGAEPRQRRDARLLPHRAAGQSRGPLRLRPDPGHLPLSRGARGNLRGYAFPGGRALAQGGRKRQRVSRLVPRAGGKSFPFRCDPAGCSPRQTVGAVQSGDRPRNLRAFRRAGGETRPVRGGWRRHCGRADRLLR